LAKKINKTLPKYKIAVVLRKKSENTCGKKKHPEQWGQWHFNCCHCPIVTLAGEPIGPSLGSGLPILGIISGVLCVGINPYSKDIP